MSRTRTADDYTVVGSVQLEEGGCNDNPYTVLQVRHNRTCRIGWVSGPHGVDCCALSDWLDFVGEPAATRRESIRVGARAHIAED